MVDSLRLQVQATEEEFGGGFEVQIFVNDVEMTSAGAGMGMDTNDLVVPANRLRATSSPTRVPVARCECGIYGCGATDVVITRADGLVHWDWEVERPMDRRVTFDELDYDAELDRFEADRSWETPERVVVRHVAQFASAPAFAEQGLTYAWASNWYRDTGTFVVCFFFERTHQIFVSHRWKGRSPEELAATIVDDLRRDPSRWQARWSPIGVPGSSGPPRIAGRRWRQGGPF